MVKNTYILYHKNCFDGFGAALCAWLYYGESAEYIPVAFGEPLPEIPDGSTVYILDFSFSRPILEALASRTILTVLDHHKTAEADLKGLPYCTFDMNKSGAKLAFEHFSKLDTNATTYISERAKYVPEFSKYEEFIEYISDRDLWENKLPHTAEVHAALSSYPKIMDVWFCIGMQVPSLIKEGGPILRHANTTVSMMCDQARFTKKFTKFGYKKVPVVNATGYWSEICHEMLRRFPKFPFVSAYFDRSDGKRQWSLRSRTNEDFDVSAIATRLGGGGHKHASGFTEKK